MNPARILAAALFLWGAALAGLTADRQIQIVQKFEAARERGDSETARALLGPDPRVWFNMEERKGTGEPWSLEKGEWDRWDHFFHRKITYSDWKSEGSHVTAIGRETNDYYRLLDWEPKPIALTWWLDSSGKITGFLYHPVAAAPTHSRLGEFEVWAKKNYPGEIAYLKPKGRMNPTKDRPERWLALLKKWREAAGLPEVKLEGQPAKPPSK